MSEETTTKTILLKKLNSIYKESLPFLLLASSISMCVLSFINTKCEIDPKIREYINNRNSTTINYLASDEKINVASQAIVVVNGFFSLVISVYGQYIKKELKKKKTENETLLEHNTSLTEQITTLTNNNMILNLPYGDSEIRSNIDDETTTNYPTPL